MKDLQLQMKEIEIASYQKQIQCLIQKICDPIPQTARTKLRPEPECIELEEDQNQARAKTEPEQETDQEQQQTSTNGNLEQIQLIEKQQKTIDKLQLDLQSKEEEISKLQSEIVSLKMKQEPNKKFYVEETIVMDVHLEEENRKLKQQLQDEREKFECHKKECKRTINKLTKENQFNSYTQTESLRNNDSVVSLSLRSASHIEKEKSAHQDHEIKQELFSLTEDNHNLTLISDLDIKEDTLTEHICETKQEIESLMEDSQNQDNVSEEQRSANENENTNKVRVKPSKYCYRKTPNRVIFLPGNKVAPIVILFKDGKSIKSRPINTLLKDGNIKVESRPTITQLKDVERKIESQPILNVLTDGKRKVESRPRSGRPRSQRTPETIKAVLDKIRQNPGKSIRKMAKECNLNEITIRRIIKDDQRMPHK
jgi:hypothetical protein